MQESTEVPTRSQVPYIGITTIPNLWQKHMHSWFGLLLVESSSSIHMGATALYCTTACKCSSVTACPAMFLWTSMNATHQYYSLASQTTLVLMSECMCGAKLLPWTKCSRSPPTSPPTREQVHTCSLACEANSPESKLSLLACCLLPPTVEGHHSGRPCWCWHHVCILPLQHVGDEGE